MPKRKARLRLLIYPRFQLTLIIANGAAVGLALAFVGFQVRRSIDTFRKVGLEAQFAPDHVYFQFLDLLASTLFRNLLFAFVLGFAFCSFVSLVLSQRLAGPILRLRGFFRSLSEGRAQGELSFREGDFFPELPSLINRALARVRGDTK